MIYKASYNTLCKRLKSSDLFKDSFWALAGSALGKGLSLLAGIVVARFLGKEVYGEYGMIKNTLLMIAVFSSFGLGYTATKFIAECKTSNPERAAAVHRISTIITLITSGLIAALLIVFASPVSSWLDAPHLNRLLQLSAIAIVFNALTTTQIGELAGYNAYKVIAVNNMIAGVFTFILSIFLTWRYDIEGAIAALVFSLILNCLLNNQSLKKVRTRISSVRIRKQDVYEIVSFSLPIALQESLYSITHWGGICLLIKLAGYGELGLSSAAGQWMAVLLFVPGALRNVALSHLSGSNSDSGANHLILKRLLTVNFVSTFIPFLGVVLFSGWISSWYGPSYTGLQAVLNVSIFTTVINALTNVYTQELIAHNQNWYLFITRLGRDCGILTILYFAIPLYGHAALTYAFVSLLFQTLYLGFLKKKYNSFRNGILHQ